MTRTEAERELSSGMTPKEIEAFADSVFGELPQGVEIPGTEDLAEKLEAARKRVGQGRRSAQRGLPPAL